MSSKYNSVRLELFIIIKKQIANKPLIKIVNFYFYLTVNHDDQATVTVF